MLLLHLNLLNRPCPDLQYVDALRLGDLRRFQQMEAACEGWYFPGLDRGAGAALHFAVDHGRLEAVRFLVGASELLHRCLLHWWLLYWWLLLHRWLLHTGVSCHHEHDAQMPGACGTLPHPALPCSVLPMLTPPPPAPHPPLLQIEQRVVEVNQQDCGRGWTPLMRCARMAHYKHAPFLQVRKVPAGLPLLQLLPLARQPVLGGIGLRVQNCFYQARHVRGRRCLLTARLAFPVPADV